MNGSIRINTPVAAKEVLERAKTELGYTDDMYFLFTFHVGHVVGRVGPRRAAELLVELVAAIRTQSGRVELDDGQAQDVKIED